MVNEKWAPEISDLGNSGEVLGTLVRTGDVSGTPGTSVRGLVRCGATPRVPISSSVKHSVKHMNKQEIQSNSSKVMNKSWINKRQSS